MRSAWLCFALALSSAADAKPERNMPDRDRSVKPERKKREAEKKRADRERAIQECMDDRDGDPDEDREACEDEVGQ